MELAGELDLKGIESLIRKRNLSLDIHKMISESGVKTGGIVFIEGPPTMNGIPHIGHLRGRVIKDLWYRYNTLCGRAVSFNGGWDTQGLPVELQAQKEMGVAGSKKEIMEKVGVENLVLKCKELVKRYNREWVRSDELLGMSMNHKKAYWTYTDEYIQREWQLLKRANETGVLEDDYTVIAYCPSCQTSLSHAEVNQGYEEVDDPSLYYTVRLTDEDAHLVVWTTMPFTLVTDAMVGVHPDERYIYVRSEGKTLVVGEGRLEEFLAEARISRHDILKSVSGRDLEGKGYLHPLLDRIPRLAEMARTRGYHRVVSEDFVDVGAGSGLVHLSPANGEIDIKIAEKREVAVFNPIDDEGRFTDEAGRYGGMFVRDADGRVVDDLREAGALVSVGRIRHKYPLCWRSRHRILWLARRGWFYKLDRLGQKAIRAAESVEYYFEQPRNRFLGIVRERHPWCISRERFWGCPIPAWNCNGCGHRSWFYSREEIVAAAAHLPDGERFELHRPWIDNVRVRCQKCGSADTQREPYVLDTWHNSGSAPYASLDDATYRSGIPAPFLTEGIDQTRGWAYTLLIENVILNDSPVPPYKSFLFQGHVLDGDGNKMSKSLGNVLDAKDVLEEHPVDLIRLYMMWKSSPIEPLNFSTDEMMARPYKILSTLYNLHLYFKQNSGYDGFEERHDIYWARSRGLIREPEEWLLSKLQRLVMRVQESNDRCRFHESMRALEEFIIDTLSQSYVPVTRGELWEEDPVGVERRLAIYAVLKEALSCLDIMIHPVCPYTSEYLRLALGGGGHILLSEWPKADRSLIDGRLEESFDLLKDAVSASSAARMRGRLKRRWPLERATVCVAAGSGRKLERLTILAASQMNVEECAVVETESAPGLARILEMCGFGLPVVPVLQPDRKAIGPKAKRHTSAVLDMIRRADPLEVARQLHGGKAVTFNVDGTRIELDDGDISVGLDASEGHAMASNDRCAVIIPVARNAEMIAKGLVKDLARRLQALRKRRKYTTTAILNVASVLGLSRPQLEAIGSMADELKFLVRVRQVTFEETCREYVEDDIDGQKIRISVE